MELLKLETLKSATTLLSLLFFGTLLVLRILVHINAASYELKASYDSVVGYVILALVILSVAGIAFAAKGPDLRSIVAALAPIVTIILIFWWHDSLVPY